MSYDPRPISQSELEPLSSDVPDADKHVHVNCARQTTTAFEGEHAVQVTHCSSGDKGSRSR